MSKSAYPNAIELIDTLFDFVLTNAVNDYWRIDYPLMKYKEDS